MEYDTAKLIEYFEKIESMEMREVLLRLAEILASDALQQKKPPQLPSWLKTKRP